MSDSLEQRVRALNALELQLREAERDARQLGGRDFKLRPWTEIYRLLETLRTATLSRGARDE